MLSGCAREVVAHPSRDVGAASRTSRAWRYADHAREGVERDAAPRPLIDDAWRDTSSVTARDIPAGSTITASLVTRSVSLRRSVKAGLRRLARRDGICTIAAFASDGRDVGTQRGPPHGTRTVTGRKGWPKSGSHRLYRRWLPPGRCHRDPQRPERSECGAGEHVTVPAVKLWRERQIAATFTGVTAPEAGSPVDVRGAASGPITGLSARWFRRIDVGKVRRAEDRTPVIPARPRRRAESSWVLRATGRSVDVAATPTSSPRRSRSSVRTPRSPLSNLSSARNPLGHRAEVLRSVLRTCREWTAAPVPEND